MIQIVFCLAKPAKIIDLVNDRSLGTQFCCWPSKKKKKNSSKDNAQDK